MKQIQIEVFMKKIFIILFLLLCIIPQNSNTYALTNSQYYEQIILNEVKQNEKVQLSENELKQAIERTKNEIIGLRLNIIPKGYKTSHICYPNSVIKQISIYTVDRVVNYYFDAYGKRIGNIEYYYKNNALSDACLYSPPSLQNNGNKTQTTSNNPHHIGGICVSYEGDKIRRIGDMYVSY